MKPLSIVILLPLMMWAALCTANAEADPVIRTVHLDRSGPTPINVGASSITTLTFPKPIEEIAGRQISAAPEATAHFHFGPSEPDTSLHLICLRPRATSIMSLKIDGRFYLLKLQWAPQPDGLVTLLLPEERSDQPLRELTQEEILNRRPSYSPALLMNLLRLARYAQAFPEKITQIYPSIQSRKTHYVRTYPKCVTTITLVQRFVADDALAFEATISAQESIRYDVNRMGIRIGQSLYPVALSDGSGTVAQGQPSTVRLLIKGGVSGYREHIDIRNEFYLTLELISDSEANTPLTSPTEK